MSVLASDREHFVASYLKELRSNNAAVFIGAGMSRAAGYVDWIELLSPVARELGLDSKRETDLVSLAQFHVNANSSHRHKLNQLLVEEFSDLKEPTENHALLARLPIETYWTTNYDRLIEKGLERNGKRVDAKYTVEQLATTKRGRDAVVFKMHGDIEHPDKAILTKDDYEKYHLTHGPFIAALAGDLVEHTFLFLGFSFTDPNLDYVLARIRATFSTNQRQHFCAMKKRLRQPGENSRDYEYAVNRQALVTEDLMRFNIKTVFIDDYPEITEILRTIVNRYRRRTIFVSGSAEDYGSWGRAATEAFLSQLAARLINEDYKIASGFGLGIGAAIVTGATQQIYSSSARSIDEHLILRPFPVGIADPVERERTFHRYRQELLAQAGIALFVMGNKASADGVVEAGGMRQEFEFAQRFGLHVIPIGASGFVASELWNRVMDDLSTFFPGAKGTIRGLLQRIGKPTSRPESLIEPLMKLINLLSKG